MTVGRLFPSKSEKGNVRNSSEVDSDEMLAVLRSDISVEVFREISGSNPKREDRSYVERTIVSSARLDAGVAAVVNCLVESEKRGSH